MIEEASLQSQAKEDVDTYKDEDLHVDYCWFLVVLKTILECFLDALPPPFIVGIARACLPSEHSLQLPSSAVRSSRAANTPVLSQASERERAGQAIPDR